MEHIHNMWCTTSSVIDLGDDGDGYVAHPILICNVTGEEVAV